MKNAHTFREKFFGREASFTPKEFERRLCDYAATGQQLFFQRIVIYGTAILLSGAYYSWAMASLFLVLVSICEVYDYLVFRNILKSKVWEQRDIRGAMRGIYIGTLISGATIALFAISFSGAQLPETGHFMPMFMLISASIFAIINNRQFLSVLLVRLALYVFAIIYIPLHDIVQTSAPLQSDIWLNLFTVVFILGFLADLARNFVISYSESLKNIIELEDQHEEVKAAYAAKTEFIGTVSHELRTPLTSIKGSLDLVSSGVLGDVPDKMQKTVKIAQRNSARLALLVEDLLLSQRLDAGKLDFTFETIDAAELILDTIESFMPFARDKGVSLRHSIPKEAISVLGDRKRLEQVLSNLLSNAAKFSAEGGTIEVGLELLMGNARISVSDNGVGIPQETGAKIFEAFNQLDTSATRKFEGTGLGLYISNKIVNAHSGRLSYESELGQGTTFYVDLAVCHS